MTWYFFTVQTMTHMRTNTSGKARQTVKTAWHDWRNSVTDATECPVPLPQGQKITAEAGKEKKTIVKEEMRQLLLDLISWSQSERALLSFPATEHSHLASSIFSACHLPLRHPKGPLCHLLPVEEVLRAALWMAWPAVSLKTCGGC